MLRRLYKEELAQLNVYEIHTSASELDNLTVSCYTWPNFPYEKVRYLRLVVNFSDGYFWRECKSGDTKAFKEKRTQALEQLKSLILKFKGVKDIELVFSRHTGSGERIRMDEDGFRFNLGREFRVLRDLNRYEITLAELEHVYGEPLLLERMKEFAMVHRGLSWLLQSYSTEWVKEPTKARLAYVMGWHIHRRQRKSEQVQRWVPCMDVYGNMLEPRLIQTYKTPTW